MVKNPPANAEDIRDVGLIPGSGRSPGGRSGNPLQYSGLENPMDRGAWQAIVHSITKSWTWLRKLTMHACIISLHYCVHFCCTTKWISYMYTYVPSFLNLSLTPHPTPLGHLENWAELLVLHSSFPLAIHHTHGSVCASMMLSRLIPPSPSPPCPQVCSRRLCLYFCPANRFINTIFLDSIYMPQTQSFIWTVPALWASTVIWSIRVTIYKKLNCATEL